MKFCSKCGTQVEDDVKFCPTCGTAIEDPAAEIVTDAAVETQKERSWQRTASRIILKVTKIFYIIGIVCLGIALICAILSSAFASSAVESAASAALSRGILVECIFLLPIFIVGLVIIGKTNKLIDENKKISTGLKVCVLIFANVVSGIFLLIDSEDGYND